MKTLLREIRPSLALTGILALLLGIAYPAAVWLGAQGLFPDRANGSLVRDASGQVRGSRLLAQSFESARTFHPRPSAAGTGYDGLNSGGTNYGPTSAKLLNGSHAADSAGRPVDDPGNFDGIRDLVAAYRSENGLGRDVAVPADAVTRSGSGLDPDISLANARLQAPRVAKARHLDERRVLDLVETAAARPDWGVFGEARVNVLSLNLALDRIEGQIR